MRYTIMTRRSLECNQVFTAAGDFRRHYGLPEREIVKVTGSATSTDYLNFLRSLNPEQTELDIKNNGPLPKGANFYFCEPIAD